MLLNKGERQTYQPPRMTDNQMLALERFISVSADASEWAKKVIIWSLRQTNNLTKPVALTLWDKDYGAEKTAEVQNGAHDMNSANGHTHIWYFFGGMGTEMGLEHHYGGFEGNSFNSKASARTIWVAFIPYDRDVIHLEAPTLEELEAFELPTLY